MSEKTPSIQASPILFDWAREQRVTIEWLHEWRKEKPMRRREEHEYIANGLMTGPADSGELPLDKCFEDSLRRHTYQCVTAFGYDAAGNPRHYTAMWPI